jgi:hypothetical protein
MQAIDDTFFNITRKQIKQRQAFKQKLEISKLFNKDKVYILHFKYTGFNPWAWLIQKATTMNGLPPINHTAITYKIYDEEWTEDKAVYIVESVMGGTRVVDLFSLLKDYKGKIWIEEVEGLTLDDKIKKRVDDFVVNHCIGNKYSFFRAFASFQFNDMGRFLTRISKILKWIASGQTGGYCSETAGYILNAYAKDTNLAEVNKGYKEMLDATPKNLYPAPLFGKLGKVMQIK